MPSPRITPSPSSATRMRRGEAAGRSLVAAWQASGLPQAAFARGRGVSAQQLSYWRHRLGQRAPVAAGNAVGFVEIPPAATTVPTSRSEVVVEVRAGVSIRVAPGFDPALLRAVVSALLVPVPAC